jgi:hypothetical protein
MNGLAEIIAINEHAALKAEDAKRRKLGLKPKSEVGKILRKTSRSSTRLTAPKVRMQGREVNLK